MRRTGRRLVGVMVLLVLAACSDAVAPVARPAPAAISQEAESYFCSAMSVLEHDGPKGQVLADAHAAPLWFATVRQTVIYTMLPEAPADPAAVYVSDLAVAPDWRQLDHTAWVDVRDAWFVVDTGLMGSDLAQDLLPFSDQSRAEAFALAHGGRVLRLADLTEDYVLYYGTVSVAADGSVSPATP